MDTGQQLFDHYQRNGFSFSPDLLSRYALSLHSKPFVILSGISGTGKTKIAQLFPMDQMVSNAEPVIPVPDRGRDKNRISVTITAGFRNGDPRGNIARKHMDVIFEADDLATIEARIPDLKAAGNEDNIIDPVILTIETPEGEEEQMGVYVQRATSPLIRLRSKSKRGEQPEYDFQPYLQENFNIDDTLTLEKISARRFRIVGANEEDVTIAQSERISFVDDVEKQLFVSVKSDWTDQSEIFGYYDPIARTYIVTPILKFLLDAVSCPEAPFHLILDEMNLSKVEHYFSDFLSCLESRFYAEDHKVHQASINLHNYGGYIKASNPLVEEIPDKIELPTNLYVTGTVNVDETTYMFSPKVLDRSNVIEFNQVTLGTIGEPIEPGALSLQTLPQFGHHEPVTQADFENLPDVIKQEVIQIHDAMSKDDNHFGYRTAFEIARFIQKVKNHVGDEHANLKAAFDAQIVQKILPKISGSQADVEDLLTRLMLFLFELQGDEVLAADQLTNDWLDGVGLDQIGNSAFPLSLKKMSKMLIEARMKGFTAFIN